jgi:SAM-dependent methyltransferase
VDREQHWRATQLPYDSEEWTHTKYTEAVIRQDHRAVQRLSEGLAASCGGHLTILDVGCGWADSYTKLRHLAGTYIGVEPSAREVLRARRESNMRLIRGAGERLNLVDGCVDLVLQISTLDHCFDAERTMDEVFRVLRPGGSAIVVLENRGRLSNDIRRLLGWPIGHGDQHLYYFDVADIVKLVRARGRVTFERSFGFLLGGDMLSRVVPRAVIDPMTRAADAVGAMLGPRKGQHFVVVGVKGGEAPAAPLAVTCPLCGAPFHWPSDGCAACGYVFRWIAPGVLDVLEELPSLMEAPDPHRDASPLLEGRAK